MIAAINTCPNCGCRCNERSEETGVAYDFTFEVFDCGSTRKSYPNGVEIFSRRSDACFAATDEAKPEPIRTHKIMPTSPTGGRAPRRLRGIETPDCFKRGAY